jgi:hypothetical protein
MTLRRDEDAAPSPRASRLPEKEGITQASKGDDDRISARVTRGRESRRFLSGEQQVDITESARPTNDYLLRSE